MIDLTPLDVRKKRGDFRKVFRGYDPEEVDTFLEVVAERFEELVSENRTLVERSERLRERVSGQEGREKAVQEALITAQELREEMRQQARREADFLRGEAEAEADRTVAEAERRVAERRKALEELERMRLRFLKSFRKLLERQLDAVEVEEGRSPLDDEALEISFSAGEVRESLPEVPPEAPPREQKTVEIEDLAPEEAPDEVPDPPPARERLEPESEPEPRDLGEPLWLLDEDQDRGR